MHHLINEETWEYAAKIVGDLGKNIVSIGFASYFFKDLPLPFKVGFVILQVICLMSSVYMISKKGEKYMEAIVIVGLFVIGVFALFLVSPLLL